MMNIVLLIKMLCSVHVFYVTFFILLCLCIYYFQIFTEYIYQYLNYDTQAQSCRHAHTILFHSQTLNIFDFFSIDRIEVTKIFFFSSSKQFILKCK